MRITRAVAALAVVAAATLGGAPAQAGPGTAVDEGVVGNTFGGAAVQFDMVTHGDDQYIAYFNADRNINVKHRTLPSGAWDSTTIHTDSYTEAGHRHSYKANWDSHNYLKMAVDGSGRLHLAGDMHGVRFRYWRTSTTGDVDSLQRVSPVVCSCREDSVTYPEFILRPNGNLGWLMFRAGGSGNGDEFVYEWDNQPGSWSNAGKVFGSDAAHFGDGNGNAYREVFATLDGWYHVVYSWRETGYADSNSKVSYVKTRDFRTFYDEQDRAVSTPISADAVRPTVDPVPVIRDGDSFQPNGLVNGEVQFITMDQTSVLAYTKNAPDGSKQVFVATSTAGGAWSTRQVTQEPGGVGLVGNNYPDNYVTVVDYGVVAIDYRYSHDRGQPTRRVTFPLTDVGSGPFVSTTTPDWYPASAYPAPDPSYTGETAHFESDSRTHEQTGGIANRNYVNSRPYAPDTMYVMSWLAGPDLGATPSDPGTHPTREIRMFKVTY